MSIKQLRKYIFPQKNRARVPLQFVDDYDITRANHEQKLVMLAGYARSPKEAQRLMDKHKVNTARALLPLLPPRRKRKNPFSQLAHLVSRIEGARRGAYPHVPKQQSTVWIKYRYKDKR